MVDVGFTHLRLPRDLEMARTSGNLGPMEGISREKQVVLDAARLKIFEDQKVAEIGEVCESSRVEKSSAPFPSKQRASILKLALSQSQAILIFKPTCILSSRVSRA